MKIECKYSIGDEVYHVSEELARHGVVPILRLFEIRQIRVDGQISYIDNHGRQVLEDEVSDKAEYAIEQFIVNLRKELIKQKEGLK